MANAALAQVQQSPVYLYGMDAEPPVQLDFTYFDSYLNACRRQVKGTTLKGYKNAINHFKAWLTDNGIIRPTQDDLDAYKNGLAAAGMTAGTQSQYLRTVRSFFSWTATRHLYPNIGDGVKGAKVRNDTYKRDALTKAEQLTVENSIDRETTAGKRLYCFVLLAGRRGLRDVEISRLCINDLIEKDGLLWVNIWGKGHDEADTERAVDDTTRQAIADYLTVRGGFSPRDPLFVSTGNRVRKYDKEGNEIPKSEQRRLAPTTISTMLKGALLAAGFNSPRLTAHSFRHGAITRALECSGDNIQRGRDFARHVDPATTERYRHINTEKADAELVIEIENSYRDDDDTAAIRSELINQINAADADELREIAEMLKNGRP